MENKTLYNGLTMVESTDIQNRQNTGNQQSLKKKITGKH